MKRGTPEREHIGPTRRLASEWVKALTIVAALVLVPKVAFAASTAAWEKPLDALITILQGGIARSVAILAIIAAGFLAWFSYLRWTYFFFVLAGVILVFGAPQLADVLIAAAAK